MVKHGNGVQFHISPGPKPQRTPLPVKLVLPDHQGMLKRLRLAEEKLEGTQYKYEQKGNDMLLVTDPWGQQFEVLPPAEQYPYERGIKDITLPCAPGTAAAIGQFFEKLYMVSFCDKFSCDDELVRLSCLVCIC